MDQQLDHCVLVYLVEIVATASQTSQQLSVRFPVPLRNVPAQFHRYHIALTHTGGTYVLYLNGVALRTVTGVNTPASLTGSPTSAWLGTNSGSNIFEGRLRDVRVYSRALS